MADKKSKGFDLGELFTDRNLETEGVWVPYFGGSKLKIASMQSPIYKAYLAKLAKKHKLQLDDDNDDAVELVSQITAQAMAKHILLDWEGIDLPGKPDAKYTPELGEEVLLRAAKFKEFVAEAADEHTNFKTTAEAVKKS